MTGGTVYMNPGVYILGGTCSGSDALKANGGNLCVFGAPACDVATGSWNSLSQQRSNSNQATVPYYNSTGWSTGNCQSTVFTPTTDSAYASADTWYYYCSPWGMWDPNVANENVSCASSALCTSTSAGHPSALTTAPVFLNQDGTASTTPLNGVTIFAETGNIDINGNFSADLAAPNPCYGNGSGTAGSTPTTGNVSPGGTVNFVTSVTSGGTTSYVSGKGGLAYNYPSASLSDMTGVSNTGLAGHSSTALSSSSNLYPNADVESQCKDSSGNVLNMQVWNNEFGTTFPTGQHLHFIAFAKNSSSSITLTGGGSQNFVGIVHTWPFQSTGNFPGPPSLGEGYASDAVNIGGTSGGNGGPAFLFGQVIGDNLKFTGSALVEVFNRPGGRQTSPGVGLVQ
jgi:hypothetical protein